MSSPELPQRPAFHALNESTEFDRPPFSRLAYVAFATGLLSLLAAFSTILLPLAMLSLGLGVAVMWKLTRDEYVAGRWLAQIGLALSAAAIVWSIDSTELPSRCRTALEVATINRWSGPCCV